MVKLEIKNMFFKDIYHVEKEIPIFNTLVNGEWATSVRLRHVYSPIDGSLIAKVPSLEWEQIDTTLEKVYRKGKWEIRDTPGDRRL